MNYCTIVLLYMVDVLVGGGWMVLLYLQYYKTRETREVPNDQKYVARRNLSTKSTNVTSNRLKNDRTADRFWTCQVT